MQEFELELRQEISGDVRFDSMSRTVYAVDASIYEIEPIGIVIPRTVDDVVTAVTIANKHTVPIIPRGAATGIVGGCIGKGLIIDTSIHLNNILEIDIDQSWAICQPGVVQDELNAAVGIHGLRLGPNTSTGNRATIGGMVGNNSAGSHSPKYGQMLDHVLELDIVLSSGETVTLSNVNAEEWHDERQEPGGNGRIHRELYRIRNDYGSIIKEKFPRLPRQVSGYNLDRLIGDLPYNPCSIVVGSEGSLGIVTRVKVALSQKPNYTGLAVLHFDTLHAAMKAVAPILEHHPSALELVDSKIIEIGKQAPLLRGKTEWLKGDPAAILIIEFDARTQSNVAEILETFIASMQRASIGYAQATMTTLKTIEEVWALRKSGLGLLLSKRSYSRAIAFIEDVVVPPEKLPEMMDRFSKYLTEKGKEAGFYGHVGAGAVHIRPWINTRDKKDLALMQQIMDDVTDMVIDCDGSLSAEHGDGLCRSWLNEKMFGPDLYQAFKEIKAAFDPKGRMNPGKVIGSQKFTDNLRATPSTPLRKIETFLNFSSEGGFELAADLCNGNASCRKKEGLMCPSFQASGDEYHTTRARAQALRGIINGRRPVETLTSDEVYDVLDLCVECKGCKTECPSQVDMAKMKSEVLYHHNRKHGTPFRSRLFGHVATLNKIMRPFSRYADSRIGRWMQSLIGIAPQRLLPPLAKKRFSKWWKSHPKQIASQQVVLFIDTFTEYNTPEIGIAAVQILEGLGYQVIIPPLACCGRPMLSKGLLPAAKRRAQALITLLEPYTKRGLAIVGLEPSCILTVKDDYPSLSQRASAVSDNCLTFDQFLDEHIKEGKLPLPLKQYPHSIKVHGHCHQKALVGMDPTRRVLEALPGCQVEILPSGCCGMAGSFGYEKEHYDFSIKIGEATLFPLLREPANGTIIVANGTSCRAQIEHVLGHQSRHLAEVIVSALRNV